MVNVRTLIYWLLLQSTGYLRDNVNFRWNQLLDWMELDSLGPGLKWLQVRKSLDFYWILIH